MAPIEPIQPIESIQPEEQTLFPITVLYHANCNDGFAAAWAAFQYFKHTAKYIPVNYAEPVPVIPKETAVLLIVDFSYPLEILQQLSKRIPEIIILDHHKTAQEALAQLNPIPSTLELIRNCPTGREMVFTPGLFARFNMLESGASLTWRFFYPEGKLPPIIAYAKERDLFTKRLPYTDEIYNWMLSYEKTFAIWDILAKRLADEYPSEYRPGTPALEGQALMRKQRADVGYLCTRAYPIRLLGYTIYAVNTPINQSECGQVLLSQYPEIPFSLSYFELPGHKIVFSLRSSADRENFDVSKIAENFGGGGHRNAAGFVLSADKAFQLLHGNLAEKE